MKNMLSPWALSACADLSKLGTPLQHWTTEQFEFTVHTTSDSLWMIVAMPTGRRVNFRMAYTPGSGLELKSLDQSDLGLTINLTSDIGDYKIAVSLDLQSPYPILRYTTTITPNQQITFPYWPRDIIISEETGKAGNIKGTIHAKQEGTRSGFCYFSVESAGSVYYLQNLTALNPYFKVTSTSAANTVGGQWPELGFALPTSTDQPVQSGEELVISDAIIALHSVAPKTEEEVIQLYLNMLSTIYPHISIPETVYQDWPTVLDKGLKDLIDSPGCWSQVDGHQYFNAYVSDYETPPEIMVQLAVLLPLLDYVEWSGETLDVMKTIKAGLPSFYDQKLKTIMRWLPAAADKLKGEEEQKVPLVMDSWYLHHPLLNLSRLALKGDKEAEELFLGSIDFAIKVARNFKYKWPVFYKMDTLEVIKAETAEGKGGEKDVAGLYAHVMLQAWELTADERYLREAEKAAKTLAGYVFEVFYQANNTAFSSGALLRLYKITKNELYLNLSYMCLASVFRNTQLWECDYGYGKNLPTFFALFPLNDAPYTAVYEEQEVFCALHDYLKHAEGVDILPSVKLLIAEYIRNLVNRAVYYYPTMLPKEMLEEKAKVGEIDHNLWIALEDLHDGWEKSGSVGQEVYGAGNAFGILPRHYFKVPGQDFMIYVDYPTSKFTIKNKSASLNILGDGQMACRVMLVKTDKAKLPEVTVEINGKAASKSMRKVPGGHLETQINGNSHIKISWS